MNTKLKSLLAILVVGMPLLASSDQGAVMQSFKGSAELERMKSLAGVWKGKEDMGQGVQEVVAKYSVTAGGSAVVETLFPDTPHEMVSIYYDEGGKLAMTHYCMLANQPHMKLSHSTTASVSLTMVDKSGISSAKEAHMHALTISFISADSIEHRWTHYKEGKESNTVKFNLTRSR